MTGSECADADPAAFPPGQMTETEFRSLYDRLRGQLPWGPDDRRGALNYIHGNADSHVDALCHVIFDGKLYNIAPLRLPTGTGSPVNPIAVV